MSDLRTEIDQSHKLSIEVPASLEPGSYNVHVETEGSTEASLRLTRIDNAQAQSAARSYEQVQYDLDALIQKLNIKTPAGWSFDREDANSR